MGWEFLGMTTGVEKLGWLGRTHISGFLKSWGIPSRHHACFNTKHGHPLDDARGYPHDFGNLYSIKRLINPISYPIISHHIYSHCLPICKKNSITKVRCNDFPSSIQAIQAPDAAGHLPAEIHPAFRFVTDELPDELPHFPKKILPLWGFWSNLGGSEII